MKDLKDPRDTQNPEGARDARHPELLLPAGSLPVLKTAVLYGADAVYIGEIGRAHV